MVHKITIGADPKWSQVVTHHHDGPYPVLPVVAPIDRVVKYISLFFFDFII
jgi:hypothetical protein